MSRRRKQRAGACAGEELSPMSPYACTVAVSEMTNVPVEEMCGYVLVTWSHRADRNGHDLAILPGGGDWRTAEELLGNALADLRAAT